MCSFLVMLCAPEDIQVYLPLWGHVIEESMGRMDGSELTTLQSILTKSSDKLNSVHKATIQTCSLSALIMVRAIFPEARNGLRPKLKYG